MHRASSTFRDKIARGQGADLHGAGKGGHQELIVEGRIGMESIKRIPGPMRGGKVKDHSFIEKEGEDRSL